jgi:hypothetical protein
MKKRTTILQIIRVAWLLYRNPYRNHLRIGQMILNSMPEREYYFPVLLYAENAYLIKTLQETNVLYKRI